MMKKLTWSHILLVLALLSAPMLAISGPGDYGGTNSEIPSATQAYIAHRAPQIHQILGFILNVVEFHKKHISFDDYLNSDDIDQDDAGSLYNYTNKEKLALIENIQSAMNKLFPENNPRYIFDIIEKDSAFIDVKFKGACPTNHGAKDAGNGIEADGKICISANRLEEKLNSLDVDPALVGLIVHEYVHEVGGNEEEARAIEIAMWNFIGPNTINDLLAGGDIEGILYRLNKSLVRLKGSVNQSREYANIPEQYRPIDKLMAMKAKRNSLIERLKGFLQDKNLIGKSKNELITAFRRQIESLDKYISAAEKKGHVTLDDITNICRDIESVKGEVFALTSRGIAVDDLPILGAQSFKRGYEMSIAMTQWPYFCQDYAVYEVYLKEYEGVEILTKQYFVDNSSDDESKSAFEKMLPFDFRVYP